MASGTGQPRMPTYGWVPFEEGPAASSGWPCFTVASNSWRPGTVGAARVAPFSVSPDMASPGGAGAVGTVRGVRRLARTGGLAVEVLVAGADVGTAAVIVVRCW